MAADHYPPARLVTDQMVADTIVLYPDSHTGTKQDEIKMQAYHDAAPCAWWNTIPLVLSEEANERISVLWTPIQNAMIRQSRLVHGRKAM